MRAGRILAVVSLALFLVGLAAWGTLRVEHFDAEVSIDQEGRLRVIEQIAVIFYSPHHGIEREIPVSYRSPATGERVTIDFDLVNVAMDGGDVPYTRRRSGSDIVLRIGDPDRTITGTYVYEIAYTVGRAVLFHDEYLQVYWNVTGNDWRIPIDRATAVFRLPPGFDITQVASTSYAGYYGQSTRGPAAVLTEDGGLLFTASYLGPGEGLTIDLSIPRTLLPVSPPTFAQRIVWFLDANKWAALPIVALVGMILLWARVGRDPRKRTIAPAFEPPPGMHPGEAGVLIDDRADLRDISAMLIGLAVGGYLTIEEIDEAEGLGDRVRRVFGRSSTDYRFVRNDRPTDDLSAVEQRLIAAIFDQDHPDRRDLSSLENDFYKHLPTIKSKLYAGLIRQGLYPHNPERTRRTYTSLGFVGIALGAAVGVVASSLYLGVAVALCGLIVLAFSPIMPRKTQKGVRALEELLGLSEYIRRAELDRIEYHDAPEKSPQLFEKLLPYAIALNLTSIWAKQFEGLLEEPPDWYVGATPVFHAHLFTLSMLHLTSGMERTFVSAPRTTSGGRSAWGGGSSFGGGFSGGGFGGGGGGGW